MRRLEALIALVPPSVQAVVDVGYDHGELLLSLARRRPELRLFGVERQPDAAGRLHARPAARGLELDLRTGDGLLPLSPGEAQVAVLAGLGEIVIADLVARDAERLAAPGRFVLCPNGLETMLRSSLRREGLRAVEETLVEDRGRFYEILAVEPEHSPEDAPADPLETLWGRGLWRDPLAGAFLDDIERRQAGALASKELARSDRPLARKLGSLRAARERLTKGGRS
ncbi:MAG: tRNA (adenine(22)-N(1))-methyltransferase TrmK [Acidobacteriota bacterium]